MSGGQQGGGREPFDIFQNLNDSIQMAEKMAKSGSVKRNEADRHIRIAQAKYKSDMKVCRAELKPKSPRSKAQQPVAPSSFQVPTQQRMQRRRHNQPKN